MSPGTSNLHLQDLRSISMSTDAPLLGQQGRTCEAAAGMITGKSNVFLDLQIIFNLPGILNQEVQSAGVIIIRRKEICVSVFQVFLSPVVALKCYTSKCQRKVKGSKMTTFNQKKEKHQEIKRGGRGGASAYIPEKWIS